MTEVIESAKLVARRAADAFGGRPEVRRVLDVSGAEHVDVLHCDDRPIPGRVSYSTVTLHQYPNVLEGQDIRVELAGVAAAGQPEFATLLTAAGLKLMKERWLFAPGVVFPYLTSEAKLSDHLPHVMWGPPAPWEQLESAQVSEQLSVHWLLAVPISERERALLLDRG